LRSSIAAFAAMENLTGQDASMKPNISKDELEMLLGDKRAKGDGADASPGSMDQSEIDKLIAASRKPSAKSASESVVASESLDQGAIDRLLAGDDQGNEDKGPLDQAAVDRMLQAEKEAPDEAAEAPSGALDQAAVDRMLQAQKEAPDEAAAASSGALDQAAIDRMLQAEKEAPDEAAAASSGALDQAAIDRMLQAEKEAPEKAAAASSGALDQAAIDRMLQAQKEAPEKAAEASSGALDQAAIDRQSQGNGAKAEPAGASGGMDQEEIDRLMAARADSTAPMDQAEIDRLMADQSATPPPETGDDTVFPGALTQSELDKYLAEMQRADQGGEKLTRAQKAIAARAPAVIEKPPPPPPAPVPPVPNALGARTLSPYEFKAKRVLKTAVNPSVTGIRRGAMYLPDDLNRNAVALNAIQRLFALASAFRGVTPKRRFDRVASVPSKFGADAAIMLTRSESHPVQIQLKGLPAFNGYQKFEEADHVYAVDHFKPNSGVTAKRWVHWFATHFERETLESLSQLS